MREKINKKEKAIWIDKRLHDRVNKIVLSGNYKYPTLKTFVNLAVEEKLKKEFKDE